MTFHLPISLDISLETCQHYITTFETELITHKQPYVCACLGCYVKTFVRGGNGNISESGEPLQSCGQIYVSYGQRSWATGREVGECLEARGQAGLGSGSLATALRSRIPRRRQAVRSGAHVPAEPSDPAGRCTAPRAEVC